MSEKVSFVAEILDTEGNVVTPIERFISVEAARAFNTKGSATIILPRTYSNRRLFRYNTRMRLYRRGRDGTPSLFGDTVWFARTMTDSHKDKTFTVTFEDAFSLLELRIVAYTSSTLFADKTLEVFGLITYDDRFKIDNMMRQYVRENYGPDSDDPARINPLIVIEEDKGFAPYGEKTASWAKLSDTIADLARMSSEKGVDLFYDFVPQVDGTFLFRVWDTVRGIDRGSGSPSMLTLSEDLKQLTEVVETDDYSTIGSYVYVLGYDTGPSQIIGEVQNDALVRGDAFGRIEYTITDSDVSVVSVLEDEGKASLRGKRPRRTIAARVAEGSGVIYGRNYAYGDRVRALIGGRTYDCFINAVRTKWDSTGEDLEIRLAGQELL